MAYFENFVVDIMMIMNGETYMSNDNPDSKNIQNIEEWFLNLPAKELPKPQQQDTTYKDMYIELKNKLNPIHDLVEKGALLASCLKYRRTLSDAIDDLLDKKATNNQTESSTSDLIDLKDVVHNDAFIYLNQHGQGHIEKLIEKVTDLINNFYIKPPTPFETFILLCAIQIHDIGNIFGRDKHEKSFQQKFVEIATPIIHDTATRTTIFRVASVHSGNINGTKDTISNSKLTSEATICQQNVRGHMLAALLRLGDELADDSSRADYTLTKIMKIYIEESEIYHDYSLALNSVSIRRNTVNNSNYLYLNYFMDSETISKKYSRNKQDVFLIDEIFSRTKKMEQERRYCMRFLTHYLSLTEIHVRIEISDTYDMTKAEVITYSLSENGYPLDDIKIFSDETAIEENTAEKIINNLILKGWRITI